MKILFSVLAIMQVVVLFAQFAGIINVGIGVLLTPLWAILVLAFSAVFLIVFCVGILKYIADKEDKDNE